MNIEEIVASLEQDAAQKGAYVEPVKEKTLEELGTSYPFSDEKDDLGLRVEDPSYVKRSCNQCYGRGGVIQSFGGRRWQVCGCVKRGYIRARRAHEDKLKRMKKAVEKLADQDKLVAGIVEARRKQMETKE